MCCCMVDVAKNVAENYFENQVHMHMYIIAVRGSF